MIAERTSRLISAVSPDKPLDRTLSPTTTTTPLSERLAKLHLNSDGWKSRVKSEGADLSSIVPKTRPSPVVSAQSATAQSAPSNDSDVLLSNFFSSSSEEPSQDKKMKPADLDSIQATPLLRAHRRPPLPRRDKTITLDGKNASDERENLYEVVVTEFAYLDEDERNSEMRVDPRAGLQAVENYDEVKETLKHRGESSFPERILIRLYGEGTSGVDIRIVSPSKASVISCGSLVLLTNSRCLIYHGKDSNIHERTKGMQLAHSLVTRHELGCMAGRVERASEGEQAHFSFLSLLSPSHDERDSSSFSALSALSSNLVFSLSEDGRLSVLSRRRIPSFSLLHPEKVLIFDFGSEITVWFGKKSRRSLRRCGSVYAEQLMARAVPDCLALFGCDGRPPFTLLRHITEGMLDSLFMAKFPDWPDPAKTPPSTAFPSLPNEAGRRVSCRVEEAREAAETATRLASLPVQSASIVLEGVEFFGNEKGVVTEETSFWILRGESLVPIAQTQVFNSSECYVIRWQFRVERTGIRRIRTGEESVTRTTGRSRIAFFYWLGADIGLSAAGLVALRVHELREAERKPQVRVEQGREPLAFIRFCLGGEMVTRRPSPSLLLVQSLPFSSARADELPEGVSSPLRSHGVYLEEWKGAWRVVAGSRCSMSDVHAAHRVAELLLPSGHELAGHSVEGESSLSHSWISVHPNSQPRRLFRLLGRESNELLQPISTCSWPAPPTQLIPESVVLVDTEQTAWLWSDQAPPTSALRIAISYCRYRDIKECISVRAGNEPDPFRAIFPFWFSSPPDTSSLLPPRPVSDILVERTRHFSLSELRERLSLPDGMDLSNLEDLLSDQDFFTAFKMNRALFSKLPRWKQVELKQQTGLF